MFLTQEKKTFDTKYINKSATNHGEVSSYEIENQNQPWSKPVLFSLPQVWQITFFVNFQTT